MASFSSIEPKILIPYSEYQRIQSLAAKYEKLIEEKNSKYVKYISRILLPPLSILCCCHYNIVLMVTNECFILGHERADDVNLLASGSPRAQQTQSTSSQPGRAHAAQSTSSQSRPTSQLDTQQQIGGNFNAEQFVEKIASIVTDRLSKNVQFRSAQPNWRSYEISEPTITSEVIPSSSVQPPSFAAQIRQNDLADNFDSSRLLKLVPKRFKAQAAILLKAFDERAAELTFNSDGSIFIDGCSIPGTNIYELLPAVFKVTKNRTHIVGFDEFFQKLRDMGLSHLVAKNNGTVKKVKTPELKTPELPKSSGTKSNTNWWYLN